MVEEMAASITAWAGARGEGGGGGGGVLFCRGGVERGGVPRAEGRRRILQARVAGRGGPEADHPAPRLCPALPLLPPPPTMRSRFSAPLMRAGSTTVLMATVLPRQTPGRQVGWGVRQRRASAGFARAGGHGGAGGGRLGRRAGFAARRRWVAHTPRR